MHLVIPVEGLDVVDLAFVVGAVPACGPEHGVVAMFYTLRKLEVTAGAVPFVLSVFYRQICDGAGWKPDADCHDFDLRTQSCGAAMRKFIESNLYRSAFGGSAECEAVLTGSFLFGARRSRSYHVVLLYGRLCLSGRHLM